MGNFQINDNRLAFIGKCPASAKIATILSIEKWIVIARFHKTSTQELRGYYGNTCGLCMFYFRLDQCGDCPVLGHSAKHQDMCEGTPWHTYNWSDTPKQHYQAACKEVRFLVKVARSQGYNLSVRLVKMAKTAGIDL